MIFKSSATKQPVVDERRYLSNRRYNMLLDFSTSHDDDSLSYTHKKALAVYKTLVTAGYDPKAALSVIKDVFLIDIASLVEGIAI